MASKIPRTDGRTEQCEHCGREPAHDVRVEVRTENEQAEHAANSREPYRVVTCHACGEETSQRMNDA